jgi:uncharacterized protein YjbJ (UPF0337 family)
MVAKSEASAPGLVWTAAGTRVQAEMSESGKGATMSTDDKFDAKADEVKGKVKETAGRVTDDEGLEAEGRGEKAKGSLKQAMEKIKDAFKR